jgi:hypothetical protein
VFFEALKLVYIFIVCANIINGFDCGSLNLIS